MQSAGNKMSVYTAQELMTVVGTAEFNRRFPKGEADSYLPTPTGKPLFRPHQQIDKWKIKPYFSQQKQAFEARVKTQLQLALQIQHDGPAAAWGLESVQVMRAELERRGLDSSGLQQVLSRRLVLAVQKELTDKAAAAGGVEFLVEDELAEEE